MDGAHTHGHGGDGLVLAVIAAVVLIAGGSGAAKAVDRALITVLVVAGAVIGVAIAGVVALLVYRARRDRPGRPIAAPVAYQLPPTAPQRLEVPDHPAIAPAREIHLHLSVSPDELAAIMRHVRKDG